MLTARFIGGDWGTTHLRLFLCGPDFAALEHLQGPGVNRVCGAFEKALDSLLKPWTDRYGELPILLSGMVGSSIGWVQTPYLPCPVRPEQVAGACIELRGGRIRIVPGLSCRNRLDAPDFMRGEETQLLGAVALGRRDGWFVLPGTHSKWVRLEDGVIRRIATFMTGELFATLATHGTLAPLMASGADDDAAFVAGLDEARGGAPLSNALFGVRARVVTGAMPAAQARSFVSGLLIGTEFVAALAGAGADLACIGSATLRDRYARAARHFGMTLAGLDPDRVYCAALARFIDRIPA